MQVGQQWLIVEIGVCVRTFVPVEHSHHLSHWMHPLAVGAQLMQRGWVRRALALCENASQIAEQRHRLGQNRCRLRAYHTYLGGRDDLGAKGHKGHEKGM